MEVFNHLSDEDEDLLVYMQHERKPYTVRERENCFECFDAREFVERFRLKKETVLIVLDQIQDEIETVTDRNHSISPMNQLLLALRFYATGSFLLTVGDLMKVSKSFASKIIKKVSAAIARLAPAYIKMPATEAHQLDVRTAFYEKAALSRVIGSLDCTHIRIQSPGGDSAELFRNRKGYFSINVQTISDTNLKIMDIVARWPGSTHDQIIFDNSAIKPQFDTNEFGNNLLVADSGYANSLHVVTPFVQITTQVQQVYNEAVIRTRNPVERQYGVWKRRFPALAIGLRLKLESTLTVIVATAVLHNIALQQNDEPPQNVDVSHTNIDFDEEVEVEPPISNFATARDHFINEYFPGLLQL